MHLRFNHTPLEKLVKMNGRVVGLPRPIRMTKVTHLPCGTCSAAKAIKSPFPAASESEDRDLWHWDMLDMGEGYETINGNRYATFFRHSEDALRHALPSLLENGENRSLFDASCAGQSGLLASIHAFGWRWGIPVSGGDCVI